MFNMQLPSTSMSNPTIPRQSRMYRNQNKIFLPQRVFSTDHLQKFISPQAIQQHFLESLSSSSTKLPMIFGIQSLTTPIHFDISIQQAAVSDKLFLFSLHIVITASHCILKTCSISIYMVHYALKENSNMYTKHKLDLEPYTKAQIIPSPKKWYSPKIFLKAYLLVAICKNY
ncbi:unnamed protein product [Vicia faba]|uniref:Peptidase S1 domain-containing protein n=1 Tax=Vicia faba TaxID=3906 RepID=A0AAV0ZBW2_VICFA|nr:unnamed protein product [Vicia faba]